MSKQVSFISAAEANKLSNENKANAFENIISKAIEKAIKEGSFYTEVCQDLILPDSPIRVKLTILGYEIYPSNDEGYVIIRW